MGAAVQVSRKLWGKRRSCAQPDAHGAVSDQCTHPPNNTCCTCSGAMLAFSCGSEEWAWTRSRSPEVTMWPEGQALGITLVSSAVPGQGSSGAVWAWPTSVVGLRGRDSCPVQRLAVWRPATMCEEMESNLCIYLQKFPRTYKWVPVYNWSRSSLLVLTLYK